MSMNEVKILKAGENDLPVIHDMAQIVFRHTYLDILSPQQMEYMMEWMYSLPNLHKQLSEGHVYFIAYISGRPCGYMSIQKEGLIPVSWSSISKRYMSCLLSRERE